MSEKSDVFKELLTVQHQRLQELNDRKNTYKGKTPEWLEKEIDVLRKEISRLEKQLKSSSPQNEVEMTHKNVEGFGKISHGNVSTNVYGDQVGGDQVGGDKITVGNISGTGIAIGRGASASVSIQHGKTASDNPDKQALQKLIQDLEHALSKVPEAHGDTVEAVAQTTQALVTMAEAESPNKTMLQITGEGLKQAAKNLADIAPDVLKIATGIVLTIGKLTGIG